MPRRYPRPRKPAAPSIDSSKSARDRVFDAVLSFPNGAGAAAIQAAAGVSSPTVYAKLNEGLKDGTYKLLGKGQYAATGQAQA